MFGADKDGNDTLSWQFGPGGPGLPARVEGSLELDIGVQQWYDYLRLHTSVPQIRVQMAELGLPLDDGSVDDFLRAKARRITEKERKLRRENASRNAILRTGY